MRRFEASSSLLTPSSTLSGKVQEETLRGRYFNGCQSNKGFFGEETKKHSLKSRVFLVSSFVYVYIMLIQKQ